MQTRTRRSQLVRLCLACIAVITVVKTNVHASLCNEEGDLFFRENQREYIICERVAEDGSLIPVQRLCEVGTYLSPDTLSCVRTSERNYDDRIDLNEDSKEVDNMQALSDEIDILGALKGFGRRRLRRQVVVAASETTADSTTAATTTDATTTADSTTAATTIAATTIAATTTAATTIAATTTEATTIAATTTADSTTAATTTAATTTAATTTAATTTAATTTAATTTANTTTAATTIAATTTAAPTTAAPNSACTTAVSLFNIFSFIMTILLTAEY